MLFYVDDSIVDKNIRLEITDVMKYLGHQVASYPNSAQILFVGRSFITAKKSSIIPFIFVTRAVNSNMDNLAFKNGAKSVLHYIPGVGILASSLQKALK